MAGISVDRRGGGACGVGGGFVCSTASARPPASSRRPSIRPDFVEGYATEGEPDGDPGVRGAFGADLQGQVAAELKAMDADLERAASGRAGGVARRREARQAQDPALSKVTASSEPRRVPACHARA